MKVKKKSASELEKLRQLEPKRYNYKRDPAFAQLNLSEGPQIGLMAQDLEKVFPELVVEAKLPGAKETDSMQTYKMVNYMGLVPVLVKAIQQQQVIIEKMQKEIDSIKQDLERR